MATAPGTSEWGCVGFDPASASKLPSEGIQWYVQHRQDCGVFLAGRQPRLLGVPAEGPSPLYLHLDVIYRGPKGNYTVFAGAAENTPTVALSFGWGALVWYWLAPMTGSDFEAAFGGNYEAGSLEEPLLAPSADVCGLNDCFALSAGLIEALHYPYHLFGPNSNTFARTLLHACGVPEALPGGMGPSTFPGWEFDLLL